MALAGVGRVTYHLPLPYQPAAPIQRLVCRFIRAETCSQNATRRSIVPNDDTSSNRIDWSTVSSNVIATVLAALALAVGGAIFYVAYQVPRQQEQILLNQADMRQTLDGIVNRVDRIEANDRRQDERIIRWEAHR